MRVFARSEFINDHDKRAIIAVPLGESREPVDDQIESHRLPFSEHLPDIGCFECMDKMLDRRRFLTFGPH